MEPTDKYEVNKGAIIVTLLFPIVGVIYGIYKLMKNCVSVGLGFLALSIFSWFFWSIILSM